MYFEIFQNWKQKQIWFGTLLQLLRFFSVIYVYKNVYESGRTSEKTDIILKEF